MTDDGVDGTPQGSSSEDSELVVSKPRVTWRLIVAIVIPAALLLAFGGVRTSQADQSAAADQRVQQLARLGNAIAGEHGLASAMEDEETSLASYIAGGRGTSSNLLLAPQAHYAVTNLQAIQVETLAGQIRGGFSPQVRAAVATVLDNIQQLKELRAEATGTNVEALKLIYSYSANISKLLALDDQIAATSGDPQLSADVFALDALSRAEDAAAQERAILMAALTRGFWQPGEQTALVSFDAQRLADQNQYQAEVLNSEFQSYQDSVEQAPIALASSAMLQSAIDNAQSTNLPVNPPGSQFNSAADTWLEGQTYTVNQMRAFEQGILNQIMSRSQTLHTQATQTVTSTWIEVLAVIVALLAIAVIAARRLSASGRIHWI